MARAERDAAILTLTAIGETLALSDSGGQSLGQWLADLYRSDREGFYRTFQVLRADPSSQAAISEAHRIIFGQEGQPAQGQPQAPLPGGSMSHTLAAGTSQRRHTLGHRRKHIPLEGHRYRMFGSPDTADTVSGDQHRQPPPPAEPEPEGQRKPRRRRRYLR